MRATLRHDPAQAGGVRVAPNPGKDRTVGLYRGGAALVAYGVYQLVNARYRNIRIA